MSAVTAALMAVSGVRRLCVSASSSAALSCSLRRAASASLARSNARLQLLIQPFDLQAPGLRLRGPPLGARRQLAGHHRRHHERDEGDPVVRALRCRSLRAGGSSTSRRRPPNPAASSAGPKPHNRATTTTSRSRMGAATAAWGTDASCRTKTMPAIVAPATSHFQTRTNRLWTAGAGARHTRFPYKARFRS